MSVTVLRELNRRLDAVFIDMEFTWAILQQDRLNEEKLRAHVRTLRRADRLWQLIKPTEKQ